MQSQLSESLHRLMHVYRAQLRLAVRAGGIDWPVTHLRVLKGIDAQPGCSGRELGRRMRADKAQITRALRELRAAGLIDSQDNPADKRSQRLMLTSDGQALRQRIRAAEDAAVDRLTRTLTPDELNTFIGFANRMSLNGATDPSQEDPPCPHPPLANSK